MAHFAAALAFLLLVDTATSQSCADPDAEVMILGAGMAGIAATNRLSEEGVTNFVIIEAQDRIGGRVRREEIGGVTVDVGANWISGIDPEQPEMHPLWALAQRCGGLQGTYQDFEPGVVYNQTGNDIANSPQLRYDDYDYSLEYALEISCERTTANLPDISAREGLTAAGWIPATPADDWVEWLRYDFCFALPPDTLSLYNSDLSGTYEVFGNPNRTTDYFVHDPEGFVKIVNCLAADFLQGDQDERLRLNTKVNEIEWSDECVCATVSENGEERKYCAPYAIITFSIGVLQSAADEINLKFTPTLPDSKLDVINQFTMGHYLSIHVEFNESFWDDVEYIGRVDDMRGYFPIFQPLNVYPGRSNANVMIVPVTGEMADRIVQQTVEETKAEIVQVLRNIYGPSVPDPIDIIIPDWETNPLFLGTYSNVRVGSQSSDDTLFERLAAPVGRLYFSGEATIPEYGYVHSGLFSGNESANAVIAAKRSAGYNISANMLLVALLSLLVVY